MTRQKGGLLLQFRFTHRAELLLGLARSEQVEGAVAWGLVGLLDV